MHALLCYMSAQAPTVHGSNHCGTKSVCVIYVHMYMLPLAVAPHKLLIPAIPTPAMSSPGRGKKSPQGSNSGLAPSPPEVQMQSLTAKLLLLRTIECMCFTVARELTICARAVRKVPDWRGGRGLGGREGGGGFHCKLSRVDCRNADRLLCLIRAQGSTGAGQEVKMIAG